jgi:hypothetical protein
VPAFNINNMEQGLAIMEAAKACDAPVIIQASRGARSYAGDIMLARMIDALTEMYPDIPICMHQDHGNNEATCMTRSARLHLGDDGRLAGSRHEDAGVLRLQCRRSPSVCADGPLGRRIGGRRTRRARLAGNRRGEAEDGSWRRRQAVATTSC